MFMKIKSLLFFAFMASFSLGNIQAAPDATGSISGKLIDEETNTALDYVNIAIYKKGSKISFKGTGSAEDGSFGFTNVTPGDYRIEGTFMGYLPFSREVSITANKSLMLGTIFMKTDSKLLGSIEITGIRSAMKFDIDKRVFSVDQSIAAAGASASDILKDIPSVDVDAEGTVSLRNSSSVTVWINGKPSGLNSDNQGQVLEQMPAESIDHIEVITNPSAKFSPEGSAGIINLVLKKERKAGYFGSLRAGGSYPLGYNFGGNFNYSSPKVDFYANIGKRNNTNEGSGKSRRQTYSENELTGIIDTSYLNSDTEQSSEMNGLFFRSGVDYHLNDKHTISLSGFGMKGERTNDNDILYTYLDNARNLTKEQLRNSQSGGGQNNYDITMDYLWEIGEGHQLQTNLSYGERSSSDDNIYEQKYLDSDGNLTNTLYQKQTGPSSNKDLEFKADYTRKFSDKLRMEAGVKSDWTRRESENSIYSSNSEMNTQEALPLQPDAKSIFDYNEKINAIYGTFTGKIGSGFGYQLGLRGEMTNIDFTSSNTSTNSNLSKDHKYFNLFPSLFLTYSFSEGNDLQLNYSRRINRPRGRLLNPFVNISDSTNIWMGNPSLDPEYANSFELNYIRSWNNHMLSTSLYQRKTSQVIQNIRYIDNGVMFQTPSNVTNSSSTGLEFIAKNHFSKKLETTSTFNFYHTSIEDFTYRDIYYKASDGFSWNARINGTILLTSTLSGQFSGFYNAPRVVAQGETKGNYTFDAGLRKSLCNGKLKLALNGRNLLNSFKFSNKSWGDGFYQETDNQFFGRTIQLNLTWNFGNMNPKNKKMEREENDTSTDMEISY